MDNEKELQTEEIKTDAVEETVETVEDVPTEDAPVEEVPVKKTTVEKVYLCSECGDYIQSKDYMVPKANCKKPTGILDSLHFGVNEELKNELIDI